MENIFMASQINNALKCVIQVLKIIIVLLHVMQQPLPGLFWNIKKTSSRERNIIKSNSHCKKCILYVYTQCKPIDNTYMKCR